MSEARGMLPWAEAGRQYTEKTTMSTFGDGRVIRQTWRQIGWVGQSGTPYPLGDLSAVHADEFGGYAPLWLLAHADEVERDEAEAS